MSPGQNSMIVGAYLIEDNISSYPISTYYCLVDLPLAHKASGGAIADQCDIYVLLHQFPSSQPRSLVQRSGLTGINFNLLAHLDCRPNHAQGGSPAHACQPAGVAMGENRFPILE